MRLFTRINEYCAHTWNPCLICSIDLSPDTNCVWHACTASAIEFTALIYSFRSLFFKTGNSHLCTEHPIGGGTKHGITRDAAPSVHVKQQFPASDSSRRAPWAAPWAATWAATWAAPWAPPWAVPGRSSASCLAQLQVHIALLPAVQAVKICISKRRVLGRNCLVPVLFYTEYYAHALKVCGGSSYSIH